MSYNDRSDGVSSSEWQNRLEQFELKQVDVNKLIMNYLITEGFKEAAEKFQAESGVEPDAGESNPEVLNELERTLALLAFEKPQNSPFSDLLDQTHRQKIASELNAAILKQEHQEYPSPRMVNILKLILWAQAELDKRNISYPKMTDLANATIEK
uniref:CSON003043 protein n=1 Tax=Culicoides sonorensis TaxID=179676 RepID=A0A336MLS8_CULSO